MNQEEHDKLYPEHAKLAAVPRDELRVIGEFLDWLDDGDAHPFEVYDGGVHVNTRECRWMLARREIYVVGQDDLVECEDPTEVPYTKERIIGMFFGVDAKKLSAEKDEMARRLQANARKEHDNAV